MNSVYGSTEKKFNEQCWDQPSIRYKTLDSLPHSLYTENILDTLNSVKYLMTSFFFFLSGGLSSNNFKERQSACK